MCCSSNKSFYPTDSCDKQLSMPMLRVLRYQFLTLQGLYCHIFHVLQRLNENEEVSDEKSLRTT